ncbi:MAG: penicillin acylase family protein [Bacteroidota bacterium]
MSKLICLFFPAILMVSSLMAQIDKSNITIYRDAWGIPHIHAGTDAELAYGLAWATAEDDFASIQESILAARGRLAEVKGREGAIYDAVCFVLGIREYIEANYESEIPEDFKPVLEAYVAAINQYAKLHPKEVLLKKVFPVTEVDMMTGYVLGMSLIANIGDELAKIFSGSVELFELNKPRGSNAIAVAPSRTTSGESFLLLNSHQPLTGPYSWYEAHLINDNMNIHGATFPGGTSLFIGANNHLGWGHTVNHPDFTDIYKLEMNPEEKLQYRYDNEWKTLKVRKLKLKVKFGFLKIPIKRKFYWSEYGPTIKTKKGFYTVKFAANTEMKHAAQWFAMNKATDLESFTEILDRQWLSGTNLVYADKDGHIMFRSNGLFPHRKEGYEWQKVLEGNTSDNNWEKKKYLSADKMFHLEDPDCGYLFNTNNSPFNCTCVEENPDPSMYDSSIGYSRKENNRSTRLAALLAADTMLTYDEFKAIKYDYAWADPLYEYTVSDLNKLRELDPATYPDIADILNTLKNWNLDSNIDSEGAAIMTLFLDYYMSYLYENGLNASVQDMTEAVMVEYLRKVKKHFKKHFKTVNVKLGDIQRHVRGNVDLPIGGSPYVLSAVYSELQKNGKLYMDGGESFIQFIRFGPDGAKIESINAYGASAKPDSPHYTDQMELFVNQELKPITLDLETVKKEAKRSYHPK